MVTQNARAAGPEAVTQDAAAAGPELPRPPVTERRARFVPGLLMLVLGIVGVVAGVVLIVLAAHQSGGTTKALIWLGILGFASAPSSWAGSPPSCPAGRGSCSCSASTAAPSASPGCSG